MIHANKLKTLMTMTSTMTVPMLEATLILSLTMQLVSSERTLLMVVSRKKWTGKMETGAIYLVTRNAQRD